MLDRKTERRLAKLDALEVGGVDNWAYYGEALSDWFKDGVVEDLTDSLVIQINELVTEDRYEPSERGAGYALPEESQNTLEQMLHTFAADLIANTKD